MDYRIFLCDDVETDRAFLAELTEAWANARDCAVELACFSGAEPLLFRLAEEAPDLLLLDIEMPGMNGMELARRVRNQNELCQIVFVTGYSDYIAEGYDVAALHYLMKPVAREKFFSVLDRAVQRLQNDRALLTLELPEGVVRVPFREIEYLEARRNYTQIVGKTPLTVKRPLSALEGLLDERFFRVGRSYIVNLTHVRRVLKSEVEFASGTKIPLPRGAFEAINRAIIRRF